MKNLDAQLGISIPNSGYFNASGQDEKYEGDFTAYKAKYAINGSMTAAQLKAVLDSGMAEAKQWKAKMSGGNAAQRRVAKRNYSALNTWLGSVARAYSAAVSREKKQNQPAPTNQNSTPSPLPTGTGNTASGTNAPDIKSKTGGINPLDTGSGTDTGYKKSILRQDRIVIAGVGLAIVGISYMAYKHFFK